MRRRRRCGGVAAVVDAEFERQQRPLPDLDRELALRVRCDECRERGGGRPLPVAQRSPLGPLTKSRPALPAGPARLVRAFKALLKEFFMSFLTISWKCAR
jgi:hypothetical protein